MLVSDTREPTNTPITRERRQYSRPKVVQLLDFLVVDEDGVQGEYSMGRTLNISEGGILLESHMALPAGQKIMITLGVEDQLIDIMGRIVYKTALDGRHQNGIAFFHISEEGRKLLQRYVNTLRLFEQQETTH